MMTAVDATDLIKAGSDLRKVESDQSAVRANESCERDAISVPRGSSFVVCRRGGLKGCILPVREVGADGRNRAMTLAGSAVVTQEREILKNSNNDIAVAAGGYRVGKQARLSLPHLPRLEQHTGKKRSCVGCVGSPMHRHHCNFSEI
ncbi:spindle pole body component alp14 [Pseudozyma hubeiensis SY62]|uniref:Spindle pole body component alp14 n=1 Tax=Pseudozyma hubeiensis (strain SY62) TaxID=1305764 RepID=R9PAZ1_PSEHS|nr:spindle pole body component alp14 [Pseudozyma hubeiensis SY62]GAC98387.1 spindle pole body component alp14 [Pseudozyma hubeiensis SY62]